MKKALFTSAAPAPIGAYTQAIHVGNTVYISGQIGLHPKTGLLVSDTFASEVSQVFANIEAIASAAGGSLNDLVALTVYLMDLKQIAEVNLVIEQKIQQPWPARAAIQVVQLPRGAAVEIAAVMCV